MHDLLQRDLWMWPGSRLGSRELGIMFGLLCSHRDTNFLSRDWSATALGCALIVAIARGSSSGAHKFKVSWLMVSRLWENERLAELNASLAQCEVSPEPLRMCVT